MTRLLPHEPFDTGVDDGTLAAVLLQGSIELGVEAIERVAREHALDDHSADFADRLHDLGSRRDH